MVPDPRVMECQRIMNGVFSRLLYGATPEAVLGRAIRARFDRCCHGKR